MEARNAAEVLEVTVQQIAPQKMISPILMSTCSRGRSLGTKDNKDVASFFTRLDKLQAEKSQAICGECQGIDKCRQSIPGVYQRYIMQGNTGRLESVFCKKKHEADRQKKIADMFESSGIQKRFRGSSWNDYKETKDNTVAVNAAKWLLAHEDAEKNGALFYGSVGSGKTKLAAIVANEKMKKGKTVLFSNVPDLLQDMRACFNKNSDKSADEMLKELQKVDCLILDDLGAERVTEWVSEKMFSLINYRMNNMLSTIITSNYSPAQLVARLSSVDVNPAAGRELTGQRIMSRLSDMCHFVELNGPDYRLQKRSSF